MGTRMDRRQVRRRHGGLATHGPTQPVDAAPRLLDRLRDEHGEALTRAGRGVHVARGQPIATPRDDTVAFILRGVGASRSTGPDGEQVIDALLGPGSTHGLTAALGHPEVASGLLAITTMDAFAISGHVLRDLVDSTPAVAAACLGVVVAEHAASRGDQIRFAGSSAAERVEYRLIELAEGYGLRDGGRVIVTLPLTQEALASWARTSRESCAKALHDLRRAGILTTGRRQLVIEDLAALRARRRRRTADPIVAAMLRGTG
jgi:CRP/FNR family cyclic AMP-dependent transcriptional regulator